ncbi:MAG: M28 family peptidase [Vicinamibacterales bacterium]|nr:M28 family peptidase [Vicinamibacterales bacterium]
MRRVTGGLAALAVLMITACAQEPPAPDLARLGFTTGAFEAQQSAEQAFASGLSAAEMSDFHRAVSARPHMAGTDGAREVAEYLQRTLSGFGLETTTYEYQVHLSHPRDVQIAITAPTRVPLSVIEPSSDLDPDSRHPELTPGFVAYSASGDVEAPIVYVNYGLPADYARLSAAGVDVSGALAIARYGRSHRAVKVHTAQEQGVRGIIFYSDPADDGYVRGAEAPDGFWRGPGMLQRGNAKFSWFWHGDPLTPGVAASADAPRVDVAAAPTLPRIPVAPLPWSEARKILERLDGPVAPAGFQGGLPFTYRTGPSLSVHLKVAMDDGLKTIRNVVARLPGRGPQTVLFGTHHDAWTFGAIDPGTAMAVLLEMGRGLGALGRQGWQPERSIEVAFWDAEEYGLIGSTEHAEDFQQSLREHAVAYVNTDMYYQGRFDAGGAATLRDFVVEVARDTPDGDRSVLDGWRESEWARQTPDRRRQGRGAFDVELRALGSGADFVPFQVFLGLPTLSLEFIGAGGYGFGTYHSNYDTRAYFDRVADPGFRQGLVLARLLGTTAMRLANAEIVPYRYSHYGRQLATALAGVPAWGVDDEGRTVLAIDVSRAERLAGDVATKAEALERALDAALARGALDADMRQTINMRLARLEQRLLNEDAPPDERWFRHVVHGWNIYAMYDGQPFPGLAEAVRLRDEARRDAELEAIAAGLTRLAEGIDEVHALVR